MPTPLSEIWVYLAAQPLLGLTLTLVAYQVAQAIHRRARYSPLANPVAIAVAMLVTLLTLTHTSYRTYFEGAQFVHFMLGPATVALAMPLYDQRRTLQRLLWPLLVALGVGVATALVSVVVIARLLGASRETILSLAPKSVTAPVAMGISEKIGGYPSLTAVVVVLTGIFGAIVAKPVLDALRLRDVVARGFAIGVAAHGIGTARAFQVSEEMGAFAGLAMGLSALLTALVAPALVPPLVGWMGVR
ncbi:MAG TPA: LrgB family protein [Burkholderiaceae bacterium]|nr:LrgB family protein [Burkholderiaceae bacterium]